MTPRGKAVLRSETRDPPEDVELADDNPDRERLLEEIADRVRDLDAAERGWRDRNPLAQPARSRDGTRSPEARERRRAKRLARLVADE